MKCLICGVVISHINNIKRHIKAKHTKFLKLRAEIEKTTLVESLNETHKNHLIKKSLPNQFLNIDKNDTYLTCQACKEIIATSKYYSNILNMHCSKYIDDYCCCKEKTNCCCQYSKTSALNFNTNETHELHKSFFPLHSTSGRKKWFCFLCYKYANENGKEQDWHSEGYFEIEEKFRLHDSMKEHLQSILHMKSIMCYNEKIEVQNQIKLYSPEPDLEKFGAHIENDPTEYVTIMTDHIETPSVPMKHMEGLRISSAIKGSGKNDSYLTCEACKEIRAASKYYSNILNKHCLKYIKDYCWCKKKNKCCCQHSKKHVLNIVNNETHELYKSFFPLLSSSGKKKWFCSLCYKYANEKRKHQDWHSEGFFEVEELSIGRIHDRMTKHLRSKLHKKSIMCSNEKRKDQNQINLKSPQVKIPCRKKKSRSSVKVKSKSRASLIDVYMRVQRFYDYNLPNLKLFPRVVKSKPNKRNRNVKHCHCCDSIQKSNKLFFIMQSTIIEKIENYIHKMCKCSDQQLCCCIPKLQEFMANYPSIKNTIITDCVSNSVIEDNFFYYYKDYPPKKYYVCSLCNSLPEILSVWSSEGFLFTNKDQLIKEMKNHLKSDEHIKTMKISKNTNTRGEEIDSVLAKKRKKAYEIYQHGLKNGESNFIQGQAGLNGSNGNFKTIEAFNVNKKRTNKPTVDIELHVNNSESNKVKKKSRLTSSILENKAIHEVQSEVRLESPVDIPHVEPTFSLEPSGGKPTFSVEKCESDISKPALARSSNSIEHQESPPINPVLQMISPCSLLNKGLQIVEGNGDVSKCAFSVELINYISSENRSKKRKWSPEKPEKVSNISLTNSQNEGASQILTSTSNCFTEECTDFDISPEKANSIDNLKEKNLVLVQKFSTLTNPHNEDANSGVKDIKEEAMDIKEEPSPFRENDSAHKDKSSSDYTIVELDHNYFGYGKRKCSVKNVTGMPMLDKSNLLTNIHNNSIVGKYTSTADNYSTDTNEIIMNTNFSKIKSESNTNSNDDKNSQINIESFFDTVSKRTGTGENLYTAKLTENSGDNDSNITVFKPAENSKKIRLKYRINSFKTSSTYPAVCDYNLNSSGQLPSTEFSQRLNETKFVENDEEPLEYIVKEEDMAHE